MRLRIMHKRRRKILKRKVWQRQKNYYQKVGDLTKLISSDAIKEYLQNSDETRFLPLMSSGIQRPYFSVPPETYPPKSEETNKDIWRNLERQISFSFTIQSKVLADELAQMQRWFPSFCPECDFSHDSRIWVLKENKFRCDNCNYVLQKKDVWEEEFEEK